MVEGLKSLINKLSDLPTSSVVLKQFDHNLKPMVLKLSNCLLDSGTSDCLISDSALNCDFVTEILPREISLNNAIGQKSDPCIRSAFHCNIFFPEYQIELIHIKVFIIEGALSFDMILGMSVLRKLKLDFRDPNNIMLSNNLNPEQLVVNNAVIRHPELNTFSRNYSGPKPHLVTSERFCIGPYEETFIPCKLVNGEKLGNEELRFQTFSEVFRQGLTGFPKFHKSRNLLKIKNMTSECHFFEPNAILGFLISVEKENLISDHEFEKICNFLIKYEALTPEEQKVHKSELKLWEARRNKLVKEVDISGEIKAAVNSVPEKFRDKLEKLLEKHTWIFSRSSTDAGLNSSFLIDLVLKPDDTGVPKFCRPYKNDLTLKHKLDAKIEEMKAGLILEPSNSAWNSPLICVTKRDKTLRLVHNYSSDLNSRLLTGHYPLAPIRVIFAKISRFVTKMKNLGKEIMFTVIDLRNGYYSISIRPEKRDMTSFIVSEQQLKYRRLSQGLKTAPSDFSSFMSIVFSKLKLKGEQEGSFIISSYLDDYIICSSVENHFEVLNDVFDRIREMNLVVAIGKCTFALKEVDFLGFIISSDGYRVKPAKLDALINLPNPTTEKQAMAYQGAFNYFTRNIPRLSFLLKPVTEQIGKKSFRLTEKMEQSLAQLRNILKKGVGVSHLNYDTAENEFIFLAVDSSLTGFGVAIGNVTLIDNEPSNLTFSHFGSGTFDLVVQSMGSRNREMIGLSRALEQFSDLLPSSLHFLAFVDHLSLTKIFGRQDLGASAFHTRVRKAYSIILNFPNLQIRHLSGKHNLMLMVDGISRLTNLETANEIDKAHFSPDLPISSNNFKIEGPKIEKERVIKEQRRDKITCQIISEMEDAKVFCATIMSKKYLLIDRLLYVKNEAGDPLLYIPENLASDVLDYLHCATMHRGSKVLKNALLNSRIFIKNRTKLIAAATKECFFCQMVFHNKFPKRSEDQSFRIKPSLTPFSKLSLDLIDISYGDRPTYYLTFFDTFSSFCDGAILSNKSGKAVAEAAALLILRYGCQNRSVITTDNGPEFTCEEFHNTLKELGIYSTNIAPYNSRSSSVERCHLELRHLLKVFQPDSSNFKIKIQLCLAVYNNSPREILDWESPLSIITGISPPVPMIFQEKIESADFEPSGADRLRWVEWHREMSSQIALSKYAYYESAVDESVKVNFEPGSLVLVVDPVIRLSKVRSPTAKGPFIVVKKNLSSLTLRNIITNAVLIRNARHCRPLHISDDLAKKLSEHQFSLYKNNTIKPLPSFPFSPKKISIGGEINEPETKEPQSRYNLRKRKT